MPPLPVLPRWLPALLFTAALSAALWRIPELATPAFAPPLPATYSRLSPLFAVRMLPTAGAFVGAPSLAQLADGRIAAAWVAGSSETATDLAVYFSLLNSNGWSEPQPIASRESAAGGLFAHIRRVGRPQLYVEGSWLHLWYAAVGIGGAANVTLAHSVSTDGGRTWSPAARLPSSPLAGYGLVPAGPPKPLVDGGLALPLQNEGFANHGEWLRFNANGRVVGKGRGALDAGASPATLRLKSGRLLRLGNSPSEPGGMAFLLSNDAGQSWRTRRAPGDAGDCAEPALLLGRDGRIHLACVWRARGIRLLSFSEAWLDGREP